LGGGGGGGGGGAPPPRPVPTRDQMTQYERTRAYLYFVEL
jgi:hypothetical protein